MQIPPAPKPAQKEKLGGISPDTVKKAYEALQKYTGHGKESAGLLDDEDELVHMLISLRKMPRQSRKDKPVPLWVPESLPATTYPIVAGGTVGAASSHATPICCAQLERVVFS